MLQALQAIHHAHEAAINSPIFLSDSLSLLHPIGPPLEHPSKLKCLANAACYAKTLSGVHLTLYICDADAIGKRSEPSERNPYVAKKSKVSRLAELLVNLVKGDTEIVPKGVDEKGEEEIWVR